MSVFEPCQVPHSGQRVRGVRVTCRCGVTASVPVNTFKGANDDADEFAATKLRRTGWKIDKKPAGHRCPGCFAQIRNAASRKSETTNVVKLVPNEPVVEQPREITREDRRIILSKLEEVYVDENVGYGPGWTDSKVAHDLGVPKAWVKMLRDENFGPEGSNENIRATIGEAQELLTQIKAVGGQAETIVGVLREILAKADKIEKTVIQIQKDVG